MKETLECILEIAEITDNIRAAEKRGDITPEQAREAVEAILGS